MDMTVYFVAYVVAETDALLLALAAHTVTIDTPQHYGSGLVVIVGLLCFGVFYHT